MKSKVLCCVFAVLLVFTGFTVPDSWTAGTQTVEVQAAAAKLSASKKTLKVGKSFTLKVKKATKKYTFTSSDPSVAKVKTKKGKKTKIVAVSA